MRLTVALSTTGFNEAQIIEVCYVYNNTLNYELIKPLKSIEPSATAFHNITNNDVKNCVLFENSEFIEVLKQCDEIVVSNYYTLNVLNNELIRVNQTPLFTMTNDLCFTFNKNIINIETLGMHYLYKYIDSFSFSNIYECLKPKLQLFENTSSRLEGIVTKMLSIINFLEDKVDIVNMDLKPLPVFVFRHIGKSYIDNLANVDFDHLLSIFATAESIICLVTCKEVVVEKYSMAEFIAEVKVHGLQKYTKTFKEFLITSTKIK